MLTRSLCLLFVFALFTSTQVLVAQDEESESEQSSEPWNLALRSRLKSAELKRGIDLSGDQGTAGFSLSLSHEKGWNGSISTTRGLETNTRLSSSFGIGYTVTFSESFEGSLDFSHTQYQSDSLNSLATLGNSLSLGLDYDLDLFAIAVSFERYFGSSPATYVSLDLSSMLEFGEVSVIPSLTVSAMWQTIDISRIAKLKQQKKLSVSTTKNLSGISGVDLNAIVSYPLGSGFSVSATPAITYSPQADLSAKSLILSIAVGIRYGVDF